MKRSWTDQLLHAIYAIIVLGPITIWPSHFGALTSGLLLGALRETEQFRNQDAGVLMLGDRILDTSFFGLGAVVLWHFFGG